MSTPSIEIVTALEKMGFPYKDWGKEAPTKALGSFASALEDGEIRWDPESGSDTLEMNVSVVKVQWKIGHEIWQLRENYRQFRNGYIERRRQFNGSLAETMRHNETPYMTAVRGLIEELGQTRPEFKHDPARYTLTRESREIRGPEPFPRYPPFKMIFHRRIHLCMITDPLFAEEYVCIEPDKTTYFDWVKI